MHTHTNLKQCREGTWPRNNFLSDWPIGMAGQVSIIKICSSDGPGSYLPPRSPRPVPSCSSGWHMSLRCLAVFGLLILWGYLCTKWGFPGGANGKEISCQCRRCKRCMFYLQVRKISWRRKRQPTPVFLLWKSHGQRSLVGYSPQGCKESDTTELI